MTVTFFGHKDTPKNIEPTLRTTLIDLIENKNVNSDKTKTATTMASAKTNPFSFLFFIKKSLTFIDYILKVLYNKLE